MCNVSNQELILRLYDVKKKKGGDGNRDSSIFDNKQLHEDLMAIRLWRLEHKNYTLDNKVDIKVYWGKSDSSKNITVLAYGNQLWIKGFQVGGGKPVYFDNLNYERDTKTFSLNPYEAWKYLDTLVEKNDAKSSREEYLMCTFLTSEMVRNEMLECIFLNCPKTMKERWVDYKLIYQNWKSTANAIDKLLKKEQEIPSNYIETITKENLEQIWSDFSKNNDKDNPECWHQYWENSVGDFSPQVLDIYYNFLQSDVK